MRLWKSQYSSARKGCADFVQGKITDVEDRHPQRRAGEKFAAEITEKKRDMMEQSGQYTAVIRDVTPDLQLAAGGEARV